MSSFPLHRRWFIIMSALYPLYNASHMIHTDALSQTHTFQIQFIVKASCLQTIRIRRF